MSAFAFTLGSDFASLRVSPETAAGAGVAAAAAPLPPLLLTPPALPPLPEPASPSDFPPPPGFSGASG
ncbi:hypothetical protein C1280_09305 [Gemmata obscuriglobus]|uniref:Uncharacterized protein n=1 Tax=Gemmata obscuriglobus TaxID=114 RepID=A0A2Z3H832_9BACT|nr:hypothetical protein C1280_09305 [Gemmata obscuriglobus]